MIKSSGRWLSRGELWFDDEPEAVEVDILVFKQRTLPVAGARCDPFYTLLIDLSKSCEEILANCSKSNQYEIRRARDKEKIIYDFWAGRRATEALTRFCDCYDRFAPLKNLELADRKYLGLLRDAGALDISCVIDKEGNDLVWHAYYRNKKRARLLHSISLFREHGDSAFRNFMGRANRLHHWQDFLRFKQEGVVTYDFGGWYEKDSDPQLLRINKFKAEFGGVVVKNYDCIRLVTIKARMLMALARLLGKVTQVAR